MCSVWGLCVFLLGHFLFLIYSCFSVLMCSIHGQRFSVQVWLLPVRNLELLQMKWENVAKKCFLFLRCRYQSKVCDGHSYVYVSPFALFNNLHFSPAIFCPYLKYFGNKFSCRRNCWINPSERLCEQIFFTNTKQLLRYF